MNKTKIDWCDMTWNPVTGCNHGCEYCYARKIAHRFGRRYDADGGCHEIDQAKVRSYHEAAHCTGPYPYGFDPTLYKDRLTEPKKNKKTKTIFVCSMADLFGDWVPDEWIKKVFASCAAAPQHRYMFLTKNPSGLWRNGIPLLKSGWYGTSVTRQSELSRIADLNLAGNRFISIEPILESIDIEKRPIKCAIPFADWVIIGAETGKRKERVIPKREWIDGIVNNCKAVNTPIFMKESLREIMGIDYIQEFPWMQLGGDQK